MAYHDLTHRIRTGWHNAADLTDTYEIVRFTRQDDMPPAWKWLPPLDAVSGVFDEFAEFVESLEGGGGAQGYGNFTWSLGVYTPLQWQYWVSNIYENKVANQVTVSHWDRSYGWRVSQAWIHRDRLSVIGEPGGRQGYLRIRVPFLVIQAAP